MVIDILHISAGKWSHAKTKIKQIMKQPSVFWLIGKRNALRKKERNEKRGKNIAEASYFVDKLIRLNMIIL